VAEGERLKLGKGVSFVKTHLKRLPRIEDVWQADLQPFPEAGKGPGPASTNVLIS
jgi:hypothetical protein